MFRKRTPFENLQAAIMCDFEEKFWKNPLKCNLYHFRKFLKKSIREVYETGWKDADTKTAESVNKFLDYCKSLSPQEFK